MEAVVLKAPRHLVVEDIPLFDLADDQVMVQVEACGICGSDLRYFQGENPWALHTKGVDEPNPPNIVLGHEFVGRVVDAGGSQGASLVGKRVAVLPYRNCQTCYNCRHGMHNLCPNMIHLGHGAGWGKMDYYPGGMAEFCPVWAEKCYVLPERVPPHEAALLDGLGVSLHAVRRAGFEPGRNVAVIGCGPIGLGIAAVARAWGAHEIFCVDVYDVALAIAREVTGGHAIDARTVDPVAYVHDQTAGLGVSFAFDTVCTSQTQRQGLSVLGNQGMLLNLATKRLEVTINLADLGGERMLRGSSNYRIVEFPMAVELLVGGQIEAAPWITHRVPLERVPDTFAMLLDKEDSGAFKAVVEPQGGSGRANQDRAAS